MAMLTGGGEPNFTTFGKKQLSFIRRAVDPSIDHMMAAGGIRSSKSWSCFGGVYNRALLAPGSKHAIAHRYANTCYLNLWGDTMPKFFDVVQPGLLDRLRSRKDRNYINVSDHILTLENGSSIFFGGLDDARKWRGSEFSTIWVNEANFIDYDAITDLNGRLSERKEMLTGGYLDTKMLYDLNPQVKSSWEYQVFVEGVIPGDRTPIENRSAYFWKHLNPIDNAHNLGDKYFEKFKAMSAAKRMKEEHGLWAEDNPNALFQSDYILRRRVDHSGLRRILIAIDPAGSSHKKSDLTGIIVAGVDDDGHYYVLEDASGRYKPDEWASKVMFLYNKYEANEVVAERNHGGDMVEAVFRHQSGAERVKFTTVWASRGKRTRAEPIQLLYQGGQVSHPEFMLDLETQMFEFDSVHFKGSPDRVDAMVWALTALSEKAAGPSPVKQSTMQGYYRQYA